jgi:hypothetical protein
MLHLAWQKHGIPPCVVLGRARLNDLWCPGCGFFVWVSEQAQSELEQHR